MESPTRRIGLLHLAPVVGELEHNRALIVRATEIAAAMGAEWIVSGELVVCGYGFAAAIGTDWIEPQPDAWLHEYAALARRLGVTLFVDVPERAPDGRLFNTIFVIDRRGGIVAAHRKICVIPGSEDWSSAGDTAEPVVIDGVRVGLLVCSDFYPPGPAARLAERGAQVLLSAAAWDPGEWGPDGEWEARSSETGLPVVVCNRTGIDRKASYLEAVSVLVEKGERVATLQSAESAVFVVELTLTDDGGRVRLVDRRVVADER